MRLDSYTILLLLITALFSFAYSMQLSELVKQKLEAKNMPCTADANCAPVEVSGKKRTTVVNSSWNNTTLLIMRDRHAVVEFAVILESIWDRLLPTNFA